MKASKNLIGILSILSDGITSSVYKLKDTLEKQVTFLLERLLNV